MELKYKLGLIILLGIITIIACCAITHAADPMTYHYPHHPQRTHMTFSEWNNLPKEEKIYRTVSQWNDRYHKGLTEKEIWKIVEQKTQKKEEQKKVEVVNNTPTKIKKVENKPLLKKDNSTLNQSVKRSPEKMNSEEHITNVSNSVNNNTTPLTTPNKTVTTTQVNKNPLIKHTSQFPNKNNSNDRGTGWGGRWLNKNYVTFNLESKVRLLQDEIKELKQKVKDAENEMSKKGIQDTKLKYTLKDPCLEDCNKYHDETLKQGCLKRNINSLKGERDLLLHVYDILRVDLNVYKKYGEI